MPIAMMFLLMAAVQPVSPAERDAIEAAVKEKLRDPDSARFRDIKRTGDNSFCGWVNAKNGLGGYTGFAVFYTGPKGTALLPPELSEPELC